jgi:hypothetical protein
MHLVVDSVMSPASCMAIVLLPFFLSHSLCPSPSLYFLREI